MKSNLLVKNEALVVDIMRTQQCLEIVTALHRSARSIIASDEMADRILLIKSNLEDLFHEFTAAKRVITSELIWSETPSGLIIPPPFPGANRR